MKRISMNVDDRTAEILASGLAEGLSMTAMMKRCTGVYQFLMEATARGEKILIEDRSGTQRQVILLK